MFFIRPFHSRDAKELAAVHHDSYHSVSKTYRPDDLQYFPLKHFYKKWEGRKNKIFPELLDMTLVAIDSDSNRILGFTRFGKSTEDGDPDDTLALHQFYVNPEHSGVGSALVHTALSYAEVRGFHSARIERNIHNTISKNFQRKMLAEDAFFKTDIDVEKGQNGASHDITSPVVVSYLRNISISKDVLGQRLSKANIRFTTTPEIEALMKVGSTRYRPMVNGRPF